MKDSGFSWKRFGPLLAIAVAIPVVVLIILNLAAGA